MIWLKQWGLKRSGTNYCRWLIEENFREARVLGSIGGWKHGPPGPLVRDKAIWWRGRPPRRRPSVLARLDEIMTAQSSGEIRHLLCIRHPGSWICSFFRFELQATKGSIQAAKAAAIVAQIKAWNNRTKRFIEFAEQDREKRLIVRYEDLWPHPDLTPFEVEIGLNRHSGQMKIPERRVKDGNDSHSTGELLLKESFRAGDWRSELGWLLPAVQAEADDDLMKRFCYEW